MGAFADFLSKPILVGFLNGIALSIMLGQIGKIFGFPIVAGGIVPRLVEFVRKLGLTYWPTLAVGLGTFLVLVFALSDGFAVSGADSRTAMSDVTPRLSRRIPAPLVAMIVAAIAARLLGLEAHGVKTVAEVPAGLPGIRIPRFPLDLVPALVGDASGLALVTSRSAQRKQDSFIRVTSACEANSEFSVLLRRKTLNRMAVST